MRTIDDWKVVALGFKWSLGYFTEDDARAIAADIEGARVTSAQDTLKRWEENALPISGFINRTFDAP